jgi:hypothetical protein
MNFWRKTGSPPPHERMCSPPDEKRWIRFWPYPSETKMSPFGACFARVGMLNGAPGAPGVPRVPRVSRTSPDGACLVTVWTPVSARKISSSPLIQMPWGDEKTLPQSAR